MTTQDILKQIEELFLEKGNEEYHGEAVSQLEHALQAAYYAELEGARPDWIAAALLHDIGHLLHHLGEHIASQGIDDRHEELGYRFLVKYFQPVVAAAVRLHVPAKRYLCTTEPSYLDALSPASVMSLELQGGPMSESEIQEFEANPHFQAAVDLRRWDDRAKLVGLQTPPFSHFRSYLEIAIV